jgi:hypothetical protein
MSYLCIEFSLFVIYSLLQLNISHELMDINVIDMS